MAFPATYNFSYYRGDTFTFSIKPKDVNNVPLNLQGFRSQMKIVSSSNPANAVEITPSINASTGTVTVEITPALRNDLTPGTYNYDLEVSKLDSLGETIDVVYTLIAGRITVVADITETALVVGA